MQTVIEPIAQQISAWEFVFKIDLLKKKKERVVKRGNVRGTSDTLIKLLQFYLHLYAVSWPFVSEYLQYNGTAVIESKPW